MTNSYSRGLAVLALSILFTACGKVAEVTNSLNLPGHWLMTESEHSNKLEQALENESMVLTFKDGQAAFSPTDSVKGQAVYAALSRCSSGPRPYKVQNNDLIFGAITGCKESRVKVTRLDANRLKFTDPGDPDTIRTFVRINEDKFNTLVKASDKAL